MYANVALIKVCECLIIRKELSKLVWKLNSRKLGWNKLILECQDKQIYTNIKNHGENCKHTKTQRIIQKVKMIFIELIKWGWQLWKHKSNVMLE